LSESGAICEYIINFYANGKLAVLPSAGPQKYAQYLYWLHFVNGTLQAEMVVNMFLGLSSAPPKTPIIQFARQRMDAAWKVLDDRLAESKWLAGDEFSAADIMAVYCPTTQRYWGPRDNLGKYKNLLRWLKDCAARPAYQKAMSKGDPEMHLLLGADPPSTSMMEAGGTKSDHWKKPPHSSASL
jgi:glutathione S-transferase